MISCSDNFLSLVSDGRDWKALELAVLRLLEHCGWTNLQYVGESGDRGADILGVRFNPQTKTRESYLFQVKAVTADNYVGSGAIDQAVCGQGFYGSKIAVVVTNGDFRQSAYDRRDELNRLNSNVRLWNGAFLESLLARFPEASAWRKPLRPYQLEISDRVVTRFEMGAHRAFFIVATGLGKTVIASDIARRLYAQGMRRILVVCHSVPLAIQLQQSFWGQIGKSIKTRLFLDGRIPVPIDGINFGLYQTLFVNLGGLEPGAFDVIIVDEAHHARANAFETCISHLRPKFLVGMTATPWRQDGLTLERMFGEPLAKMSLVDGMRMHYLAQVDYRLMCDNINWREVSSLAHQHLTISDLNKRLFLPQRDETIVDAIKRAIESLARPKIAVFSPSVAHAKSFARLLNLSGVSAGCVTSEDRPRAHKTLLGFSSDRLTAITAVDILNEGIDVPDINVLVFLRATHSRRIFVQQLGRGLRLGRGKTHTIVLDFVTDIRRLALVKELNDESKGKTRGTTPETVYLKDGVVTFSDHQAQRFVDAWLNDVASLEDKADAEKLEFPTMKEE